MGYKRPPKIYKLRFVDEEFDGLEVRAKSISTKILMEISSFGDLRGKVDPNTAGPELERMFEVFSKSLVSWNLEDDDGNPVPPTVDGILEQDIDFMLEIISAWMEAIAGVPEDLKARFNGGGTSLAESIPMEISVPNLGN